MSITLLRVDGGRELDRLAFFAFRPAAVAQVLLPLIDAINHDERTAVLCFPEYLDDLPGLAAIASESTFTLSPVF